VWLHPSSNKEVLRTFFKDQNDYYQLNLRYLFNDRVIKSHCSKVGPRNKLLAPLIYKECFCSESDGLELKCSFIDRLTSKLYRFITNSSDIDAFNQAQCLIEEFLDCVKTVAEIDISKFKNEPVSLTVKGKSVKSNELKMLIDRVESFTIDGLPFHKVESTQDVVAHLETILPELKKLSEQPNKSKFG
jgi:hypothetical protein